MHPLPLACDRARHKSLVLYLRIGRAFFLVAVLFLLCSVGVGRAGQVVINEIHYHPVEEASFDADGHPLLDLSDDVHEFVEIYNPGNEPVFLDGWRLESGVQFTFPSGTTLPARGYLVIAAQPQQLVAVREYALTMDQVLGPYSGRLGNGGGETVRLRKKDATVVDSVAYSSEFPWPTGADALGAAQRWSRADLSLTQYRGRSLERISPLAASNDPSSWKASAFPGAPTPGRENSVSRSETFPIVLRHGLVQFLDGGFPILASQASRVDAVFSSSEGLGAVRLEYFVDEINRLNESVTQLAMVGTGSNFSATLPPFTNRSVVRYRIKAERRPFTGGSFEESVLPRSDDTFPWMGFFVVTNRPAATNDVYDLFLSTNSINQLSRNFQDNPNNGFNPKPGTPVLGRFNDTEPGVLAYHGRIYDVQVRHSGSFYRRDATRMSYKVEFPASTRLRGYSTLLLLEKGTENILGHRFFQAMSFPTSRVRPVDLYFNNQPRLVRLEFEEHDDALLQRWADEQKKSNPDQPRPGTGHLYKSSGYNPVGPYGPGTGVLLGTNEGWTPIQRYEWVYSSKNKDWEGYGPFKGMMDEIWAARGPLPNTDVARLKTYLEANWDVDTVLTYLALRSWMGANDDNNHNYFLWKRADGRWTMLPWDFDGEMSEVTRNLFYGENLTYFKDAFFKCFPEEFKRRLWWISNTFFHPDSLLSIGFEDGTLLTYAADRMSYVNSQTYGVFERPRRPVGLSPMAGESISSGARLVGSEYAHTRAQGVAHDATIWSIRSEGGTFNDPVYSITSRTDRLSFPIPTGILKPGGLYFWRASYLDAEGFPSLPSKEMSFHFGGSFRRVELISLADSWRYLDTGTNLGKAWREPAFDDSKWGQGRGVFGVSSNSVGAPLQTPLKLGVRTYYFRKRFVLPSGSGPRSVLLRQIVDDGAVFYLNGKEMLRVNLSGFYAPGAVPSSARAVAEVGTPLLEMGGSFLATNLIAGENLLAVEVHQFADNSPDVVMGATLESAFEVTLGSLRFNELLVLTSSVTHASGNPSGWVELVNPASTAVDMSGVGLSDDPAVPLRFRFPPGSVAGPRASLIVWFDGGTKEAPGFHADYSPPANGGTLWLHAPDEQGALLEVDRLAYGLQIPDYSVGRIPDRSGAWVLTDPTLGEANRAAVLGSRDSLRINEWMAAPKAGPDWFELFNPELLPVDIGKGYLTDDAGNPTNSVIPALSFLAPWSFRQFFADSQTLSGADHVDFKLSGSGESIELRDANLRLIDSVEFGLQQESISQGRLPDGGGQIVELPKGGSPASSNRGDGERDGLPDDWELLNGFGIGTQDAEGDPDQDGFDNRSEFLAGTNPHHAGSALRLTASFQGPGATGGLSLRFDAAPGRTYELQSSDSIAPADWRFLRAVGPETIPGPMLFEFLPGELGLRFYRVVLRRY